jgi:hypothetical protein
VSLSVRRPAVVVCLVSLLLVGPAQAATVGHGSLDDTVSSSAVAAGGHPDQSQWSDRVRDHEENLTESRPPEIEVTATIENAPGEMVRMHVQVVVPANVTDFAIKVPRWVEVVETQNLSRPIREDSEYLENPLLPERRVVVGFTGGYNATYRGSFGRITETATDEWAFTYSPRVAFWWETDEGEPVSLPTDIPPFDHHIPVASLATDGNRTFTGAKYVYLGNHSTESRTFNDQRSTIVVPATVSADRTQSVNTSRVFDRLGEASQRLNVGYRDHELNVFVPTDPTREGGFALFSPDTEIPNDLWIHANSTNSSVVFSEYIHIFRQFIYYAASHT